MNLVERAKNILLTPAKEWDVIKGEQLTIVDMFTKYAMILAAIPAAAGFIGYSLIGVSYGFGTFRIPLGTVIVWAILRYILLLGGTFAVAFIIDALAPTFGCAKNLVDAVKIAVFSFTAVWIAGIFYLIPAIGLLFWLASLYSLFLLYLGIQKIKAPTNDKLIPYFVAIVVASGLVLFLIDLIGNRIAFGSMVRLGGLGTY